LNGRKTENQEKSGENLKNQLLKSGDFWSGEKFKNQEFPDQIRRFGNPGHEYHNIKI
jgi:hypothetical protein